MPDFDLDQVNKVRLAMGMKPLPVPGAPPVSGPVFKTHDESSLSGEEPASTYDTRQAAAGDNWAKLQEEQSAIAKREAKKAAIKRAQEAAQRFARLEGKGLADDDDDVDTKAWLLSHKRKHNKVEKARKLERELLEREQQVHYTSQDLAGVRVGHELNQFEGDSEQILTLKDAAVDNESEEDELENIGLRDTEKLKERLNAKKRLPAYNPVDEEQSGRGILSQYDDQEAIKQRKAFVLDDKGTSSKATFELKSREANGTKGVSVSLDILKDLVPESDYREAKEVKIRKPKKSKAKSTKRKGFEDDDDRHTSINTGQDTANKNDEAIPPSLTSNANGRQAIFGDDDDLQTNLAAQRRTALKKRKRAGPEELARQLRDEEEAASLEATDDISNEEPGLIIDETSEFVANLQKPEASQRKRHRPDISDSQDPRPSIDADGDTTMDLDPDPDNDRLNTDRAAYEDISKAESARHDASATGLEDEATLSQGIGATLNMLSQRGIVKNADTGDINAVHREQQRFLAEKQKREAEAELRARQQRERDRQSGKLEQMSAREREAYAQRTNVSRDQIESRQMAEVFNREYKPNVQLKYVDEYGRQMNQKEAFKHLSHQFHGKGSGKQKTEKRMKKIEDERKKEAMSVLDASQNSTNMNTAVEGRAKKARQAGVRLQ